MPSGSVRQLSMLASVVLPVTMVVVANVVSSVVMFLLFLAQVVLMSVVEFSLQPPMLQSVNTSLSNCGGKVLTVTLSS